MQSIYTYTDPNHITEIMMNEYDNIIDIICPRIIRQVWKNYTPYINKKLRIKKLNLHKLHRQAKHSRNATDWLIYKNTKATINKEISLNKTKYINKNLIIVMIDGQQ